MPLPEMAGGIPVFIEQLGYGRSTIKSEVTDSTLITARMPTGHKTDPAGLAGHASRIVPGEPRAAFGKAVDMGRFRIRVTVAREVTVTQIVGKDENDVRFFICSGKSKGEHEREQAKDAMGGGHDVVSFRPISIF